MTALPTSILVSRLPVDPSKVPTIKAVAACREIYELRDQIIGVLDSADAQEALRRVNAIERYVKEKEHKATASYAARVLEAAVGAVLPEPESAQESGRRGGRPKKGSPSLKVVSEDKQNNKLSDADKQRFRLLHESRAVWEPLIEREYRPTKKYAARDRILKTIAATQRPPIKTPGFPDGPFKTIVIDPPWPIEKISLSRRPVEREVMDYATWTKEQLQKQLNPSPGPDDRDVLPIRRLADPDGAHVYLWVTQKYLPIGLKMFEAWGVRYECMLTWHKPTAQPLWWMYNTEHCLFGKIGSLPLLKKGQPTGFRAPQQRHSHKPEEFYELVRTVSPDRRLTMFDEPREGFSHWGIQHATT